MHSRLGRIGLLICWLVSSPSCGSDPSPAASAAAAAGSAPLPEGVHPGAAAAPAADPAGNAEDGPLCAKYGGMGSVRQVTARLLANITGDCRIRAFFAGLTGAGGQRVQDCLSIQIGELFGCAGVSYAQARADNGLECRDMRTSHIGLGVTAADFAALLEDVGTGLAAAGIDAADIDAAASSLRALAPHIVELPENTAPSRSQCGGDISRGLEPAEQGL